MVEQQDTIFVAGLPITVNEAMIAEYFGQIGAIKTVSQSSIYGQGWEFVPPSY